MTAEPDNLTLVMVGNLADNDPWNVEIWACDEDNAKGSEGRWFLTGTGDDAQPQQRSWASLQMYARDRGDTLTVLGKATP